MWVDVTTTLDSWEEEDGRVMVVTGQPGASKPFRFRLAAGQWWEIVLNIRRQQTATSMFGPSTIF